jgi:hypothetical protein
MSVIAKSKYYEKFKKLTEAGSPLVLRGANVYVELLSEVGEEEGIKKTQSGLFLAEDPKQKLNSISSHRLYLGLVLYSGLGYYDAETGEREPCDLQPGNLVILPKADAKVISTFPGLSDLTQNKLIEVPERAVVAYYKSEEDYMKTVEILNS